MTRIAHLLLIMLAFLVPPAFGAEPPLRIGNYVGEDLMVPMRDGVKLHVQVWRPVDVKGPLPILLLRSPYGFPRARLEKFFPSAYKELAASGYIFAFQDIRGREGSEGEFVMLRPAARHAREIDESTDAYDSIEQLIRTVPDNNGRVGIFGISYGGWTAAMALVNPHPALKAVSVQASPEDMFMGDDFHHNGAFRLDYGWGYTTALESDGHTLKLFDFGTDDVYDWYLRQPLLATLDKVHFGQTLPTWQNFVRHPNYDAFWRETVTSARLPKTVTVPNLIVAGWWDQEDLYGPLKIYQHQEPHDKRGRNFLVIGPWNHGGWAYTDGDHYGPFDLGAKTAVYFREQVQARWFDHWLKDEAWPDLPEALVFQTGTNTWQRHAQWPPREGVSARRLYLRADGVLSFEPPTAAEGKPDSFVSDPANPVPYRERPIPSSMAEVSTWSEWLADDQAPFTHRPDVRVWQTEPLAEDLAIVGDVSAQLFASTTGSDADWVVKLVDIYPTDDATPAGLQGRHRLIASEVFRARYRHGFGKPVPVPPNVAQDYSIPMVAASHVFKKGHRIAVHVQSSWFPLIDRNPQTFVRNIYEAGPSAFKAQTHTIFHDPRRASSVSVGVVTHPSP